MPEDLLNWLVAQAAAPALLALVIDRLWPRRRAAPPRAVVAAARQMILRLNRPERSAADRQVRGFLLWALVSLIALGLGGLLAHGLHAYLKPWGGFAVETVLLAAGIGYQAARATARRAVEGVARLTVERGELAAAPVAETACKRLAARLSEGAVGLVLAWLVLGLPGLFLVKAGQWLVHGVEDDRSGAFGRAVCACHGLVTAPGALLAGVLISPGHLPPLGAGPEPATGAMMAAIRRAGLARAMPAAQVAQARSLADQAHITWFGLLLTGALLAYAVAG